MKSKFLTIILIFLFLCRLTFAQGPVYLDTFSYQDRQLKTVKFTWKQNQGSMVSVMHSGGIFKVPIEDLSKDLQLKLGYDAAKLIADEAAQAKAAVEKRDLLLKQAIPEQLAASRGSGTITFTMKVQSYSVVLLFGPDMKAREPAIALKGQYVIVMVSPEVVKASSHRTPQAFADSLVGKKVTITAEMTKGKNMGGKVLPPGADLKRYSDILHIE